MPKYPESIYATHVEVKLWYIREKYQGKGLEVRSQGYRKNPRTEKTNLACIQGIISTPEALANAHHQKASQVGNLFQYP